MLFLLAKGFINLLSESNILNKYYTNYEYDYMKNIHNKFPNDSQQFKKWLTNEVKLGDLLPKFQKWDCNFMSCLLIQCIEIQFIGLKL